MAYTTINKSTDHFNTKLYTGNGSTNALTGVGFPADFIWVKARDGATNYYHYLQDTVRGTQKILYSNNNDAEATITAGINTIGSDGWTTGSQGALNDNGDNFVAWNWKAGTTGSGNTGGSGSYKAYSYSVNTTAGFSIVKYLGNGTSGHTIPHHLGSVPAMIIFKQLNAARGWGVYHQSRGAGKIVYLDESIAEQSATFLTATPTSSVISLATLNENNINDASYVAYCFAEKNGYSKFGSYIGNGNANGSFVYTGFKPTFVMTKKTNSSSSWDMHDTKRDTFNVATKHLLAEDNGLEGSTVVLDILSNGFKFRTSNGDRNASDATFIYMAFGQSIVGTNNIPATAR